MPDRATLSALHAMTLIASLRAAATAGRAIEERRAGRDPSTQEEETPVRAWLMEAGGRIVGGLVRLRLRRAAGTPAEGDGEVTNAAARARLVQAFEDRLLMADLALDLRTAHQKLLSLYPGVSEELVEAFRRAHAEAVRLADEAVEGEAFAPFIERTADALDGLSEALA